jgi:hypothetical protein
VRAQQGDRVRRIGVPLSGDENDPVTKANVSAFTQALAELGGIDGSNLRIDLRRYGGDTNRMRALARELVGLKPDIIVTSTIPATVAVQREMRTIPIVFLGVGDPVTSGIVAALNQPGGNSTGFALFEESLAGKWLELLSEIAPGLKRAAIMFNPDTFAASAYMPSLETAARSGRSRSCQSLRSFIATQRSKRPSLPLGANREAALCACRVGDSRSRIARRSYRRRPETTYRRSITYLAWPEKAVCSPTELTQ